MIDTFLLPGIPFASAVAMSGLILLLENPRSRNVVFMVYVLSSAWLQWINIGWQNALILLIAGSISGGILMVSEIQENEQTGSKTSRSEGTRTSARYPRDAGEGFLSSSILVRISAFFIALLSAYSVGTSGLLSAYGLSENISIMGSILAVLGLLQMSLTNNTYRLGLGMLMLITGFEILFFSLEPALLIKFLFVLVKLMTAVVLSLIGRETPLEIMDRGQR